MSYYGNRTDVAQLDRASRLADLDRLTETSGLTIRSLGARRMQVQALPSDHPHRRDDPGVAAPVRTLGERIFAFHARPK